MTKYTLIRSRRKTIAIHIAADTSIQVRAPLGVSRARIDQLVRSREKWITKHLAAQRHRLECKRAFTLDYGHAVPMRGGTCLITAGDSRARFDRGRFLLPPDLTPEEIKRTVIRILKQIAKPLFEERVRRYSGPVGVSPAAVKVSGAKTRWGSCGGRGNINLSWRLVMAEDEVIDYVIVHELAHLKEPNHSIRFWAAVESALPDYKARREKLRRLEDRLQHENWDDESIPFDI